MDVQMFSVVVPSSPDIRGEGKPRRSVLCPEKLLENYSSIKAGTTIRTLHDNFLEGVLRADGGEFIGHRPVVDGAPQAYVWQSYPKTYERITNFGAGLSQLGIAPKQTFGIFSINSPEWTMSELAGYMHNYISVPLYDTLGMAAIEYIVNQTEMEIIIASSDKAEIILDLKPNLPTVKTLVIIGDVDESLVTEGKELELNIVSWTDVELSGLERPVQALHPTEDDVATICYTSGTTGTPKGAVLTHKNFVATIASFQLMAEHGKFCDLSNNDTHISYLPLAHVFERLCQGVMISRAARIGYYQGDTLKLLDDVAVLQPTIFVSVPRLFNRIYDKVMAGVKAKGGLAAFLFNRAYSAKKANLANGIIEHAFWDRMVFGSIRARLGGKVKHIISASAPISPDVMDFLRICFSADVYEGYGQTEQAAGQDEPFPRGEILLRGTSVFKGYFKSPQLTAETLDADGWSSTGDVGMWDGLGRLILIDRVKNIFKLAQGEYIAPEKIEAILAKHHLVAQVFVYGYSLEAHVVGVVVPDADTLKLWADEHGLGDKSFEELCAEPMAKETLLKELAAFGRDSDLKGFEILKNIHLSPEPFFIENDLLTPTFKLKRHTAKAKYGAEIDRMYKEIS
ncbi:Long chain acyl-CoA synthetase 7 peroxisomal [Gamsiella multidivaricata]|nr:Long chain acyl-CoA synthetase 7 peroxisomal [Gamsiella multidivaricata]